MTAHPAGGEGDLSEERPRSAAAAPEPDINPLQRLIQQRMRERGWSYGEVARRGELPRSTVYTLAITRNLGRPPRPVTLDGLATGLDVPVAAVRAAAAQSTGLHYYDEAPAEPEHAGDPERDLLIASIDELTAEDRRHVAALVESLWNRASQDVAGPLAPSPGPWVSTVPGGPPHPGPGWGGGWPGRAPRPNPARIFLSRHLSCFIGMLAGRPSWPASSSYGSSGSTRRATRKMAFGSSPGGRST
jgi:transcriptional regulator with XRE-family HTH domain